MPNSPFSTVTLGDSNALHASQQIRQVDDLIDIMSPNDVSFLKLVGINGEAGTNPKLEWLEDTLLAESSLIAAGSTCTSSSSGTSLVVTTDEGINFQAGMVLELEDTSAGTSEHVYVTEVSTDTLTIVRACGGTSALSTFANGDKVVVVGLANAENNDSPAKGTTEFTNPYNNFQAFDQMYQISFMAANTDVYGVTQGDDERELAKAFEECAIKLENTCFRGKRGENNSPTGVPRLMGGFSHYLNNTTSGTHYGANLSGAKLTEKDLNDMFQDRFYAVGQSKMATTIICGGWNKRVISDIYAPYARSSRSERRGGVIVDVIDTEWGPIDVVLNLRCPTNRIYYVNLDYVSIHPFNGLSFFDRELPSNGAHIKRQIYGVYTMKVKNTKSMGVIYGTSTS